MNMLRDGAAWLAEQLKSQGSTSVTYARGSDSVTIAATLGRHRPKQTGELVGLEVDQFVIVMTFNAADLVLNSNLTTPAKRDLVTFTDHGISFEYEVMPIDGERCWKESDAFGQRIEIHLKLTGRS